MNKTLIDVFDDLFENDKRLLSNQNQDLEMCQIFFEKLKIKLSQDQTTKKLQKNTHLEQIFHLEQKIRSLSIQLEEERELKIELEIENFQLKKKINQLKRSLESVNNNSYVSDVKDNYCQLRESSELEPENTTSSSSDEGNEVQLFGGVSPISTNSTQATISIDCQKQNSKQKSPVFKNFIQKIVSFCELSESLELETTTETTETTTSLNHDNGIQIAGLGSPTPITSLHAKSIIDSQKKNYRKRSNVGKNFVEKRIVAPVLCKFCEASKKMKRPEDSPTLPWCPHKYSPQPIVNVTVQGSHEEVFTPELLDTKSL